VNDGQTIDWLSSFAAADALPLQAVGLVTSEGRRPGARLRQAGRHHPARFAGLAAVAPQAPELAGAEIERAKKLGLVGLLINSHTHGEYLDAPKYAPILEAAEALDMPLYLHPREPGPNSVDPYLDYGLYFATWGFAAETALHAMRLIMSGTFERHPGLRVVLGHLGEGIPYWLGRIDNRYQAQVLAGANSALELLPGEYFRRTLSSPRAGWRPPRRCGSLSTLWAWSGSSSPAITPTKMSGSAWTSSRPPA
jgi:5-carboxyvanillate decarboxylase